MPKPDGTSVLGEGMVLRLVQLEKLLEAFLGREFDAVAEVETHGVDGAGEPRQRHNYHLCTYADQTQTNTGFDSSETRRSR